MAENPLPQGYGSVMATGITGQVVGGAMAIVFVFYYHMGVSPPPEAVEQALGTLFSVVVSSLAMVGHLLVRKYLGE